MRVLIAEDEAFSRRLLESSLSRWGYEVVVAADGLEASRILRSPESPKLAVLDWLMPGLDGIQLCRELRWRKSDEYTYVILLTSKQAKSDIIEGLEAGADDYVTKPFEPEELRVRLRNGKRILHLLDQLTAAREALRDLAAHDPLTKLWNHNVILELLGDELKRAERQDTSVGVVLIDLDHFKRINDTHGHLMGDHILCEAARVMQHAVRPYDLVGRYGGEEFVMILPGCDEVNAVSHAERVRQALSQIAVKTANTEIRFTASLGVTVIGSKSRVDLQTVIRLADSALYAAKRAGRNRVEFSEAITELTPA